AAENQVKAAQAALELAKVNAELSKVTPDDISSAEAAVRSAEADYQRTQEELEDSVIASPIDGKVIVAEVKAGEGVTPGLQLFTLGRTEQVLVKAKVDEVDIGKVALDQPVEVNSSAYLGKSFTGKISKIAPRAVKDGNINVFEVEVLVENPDGALRPGMSVDVTITAEQKKDALLVPAEAVIERNGSKLVFALENGVARQRQVKTGATNRTTVEILDGLKDGDQVVVGPAEVLKSLKEGDRVKSAEAKKDAGNTKKEGGKP
ncbi:MAG: efflux RND transporter periplasmic adaptor subunit, partial [Actinobacteria bacterium]|nr:efflux RND transporter periplasmic adaptor subunit [Actinomycetota bacterium]